MSSFTKPIKANVSLQLLRKYQEHKQPITGLIEVGGDFGGGTLELFLSLSGGTIKNTWNDFNRNPYSIQAAETRRFTLPVVSMVSGHVCLYYTLSGATDPDISLTIGDNT